LLSPGYFQHVYRPEEVGPISVQVPNGVIGILVEDEAEAVSVARQYMSYFQGRINEWNCPDQRVFATWCRKVVFAATTCEL
jgi:acetyl-CoA carboxylase carboxyltransferase component